MEVPRMAAEEVKRRLDADERPLIVDVRSWEDYDRVHIAGAMSLPVKEVEHRYGELANDRLIVCY